MNPILQALKKNIGYEEILEYVNSAFPHLKEKVMAAIGLGYSVEDVMKYLKSFDKSVFDKIARSPMSKSDRSDVEYKTKRRDRYLTQAEQADLAEENIKQDQQESVKSFGKNALLAGTAGLGGMALGRSLPTIANQVAPQLSQFALGRALPGILQQLAPGMAETPTAPIVPEQPNQPAPTTPNAPTPQINPIQVLQSSGLSQVIDNLASKGNGPNEIEGYLIKFKPEEIKKFEKQAGIQFRQALEEYVAAKPAAAPQAQTPEVSTTAPTQNMPKEQAPTQEAAKHVEANKKEVGSNVQLPNGLVGRVESVKNGIAKINVNGMIKHRKLDEVEQSSVGEKDLADLHSDLIQGIEKKTGQEVSKMVNLAGYDPKKNSLVFMPHLGEIYVYDDISKEDADELTSLLTKRKTTGENFIGSWTAGTESPIGAPLSKLIKKIQGERGGKGSEYSYKFQKIYDIYEPAKQASKEKHKAAQEKRKNEKEAGKKRKKRA
jgi:hypothetical protein